MNYFDRAAVFEILLHTPYTDINNACLAMPEFDRVCQEPFFWQTKIKEDFGFNNLTYNKIPAPVGRARYDYLIQVNPNQGLLNAARADSTELARYFYSLQPTDLKPALDAAATVGNLDIVKMLASSVSNKRDALMLAAANGKTNVFNYLIIRTNFNPIEMGEVATQGGHIGIIQAIINAGKESLDFFNSILVEASLFGKLDIIDLVVSQGADDFNAGLIAAVEGNQLQAVKLLVNYGADNLDDAAYIANKEREYDILSFLVSQGAKSI